MFSKGDEMIITDMESPYHGRIATIVNPKVNNYRCVTAKYDINFRGEETFLVHISRIIRVESQLHGNNPNTTFKKVVSY